MQIIVLGAGESGMSAAMLAKSKGHEVFLSDRKHISDENKLLLEQNNISYEEGAHILDGLNSRSIIIKSPGIPDSAEVVKQCLSVGAKVISEIELASWYATKPLIAVTGSNGKTTTTSLIAHLLNYVTPSIACGNIGYSLARVVLQNSDVQPVVELSSFQLDHMYDTKVHIALLLNITPDHLDRYGFDVRSYADAKGRIFRGQTACDYAIINHDDPLTTDLVQRLPKNEAIWWTFSTHDKAADAYFDGKFIQFKSGAMIDFSKMSIKGDHNAQNVMAACLALQAYGINLKDSIWQNALNSFKGIPHRLEELGTWRGVTFINDSKGTNLDATEQALGAMPDGRTILLIGGTDKGNDYQTIVELVNRKCKALIYLTADSHKLHDAFDHLGKPTSQATSMAEAYEQIIRLDPASGDVVLLSPACASFDLFLNYEDRGTQFTDYFHQLEKES